MAKLTTKQLEAMSPTQLAALTPGQLAGLSTAQKEYVLNQINSTASAGSFVSGTTGGTTEPNVTSGEASDTITFAMPNQLSDITIPKKLTTSTNQYGATQMSFTDAVQWLHDVQNTPELTKIQQLLFNAGFYSSKSWAKYGTLDTSTIDAWKEAISATVNQTQANGQPISLMTLLAVGKDAIPTETALQEKINTAQEEAASVAAPALTLSDPNQVAQSFAAAMESIGAGAPSKEQTSKFVNAFINGAQGQIAAVKNEVTSQKQDYLQGAQTDQSQMDQLEGGKPVTDANAEGPVTVATKAMPNLDAEAMAAAKATNPNQYAATGTSYLYGIIQRMISGNYENPTSPTAPSATAPAGAIVTAPLAGAVS